MSWIEKYGHGFRGDPKPRITVLARTTVEFVGAIWRNRNARTQVIFLEDT
jgi:hypothetical protein